MSRFMNYLDRNGLVKVDTIAMTNFNDEDQTVKLYNYVAKCTSFLCTGENDYGHVIKNVLRRTIDCPDCGSVLFWERIELKEGET
jgi:hypothetical protein